MTISNVVHQPYYEVVIIKNPREIAARVLCQRGAGAPYLEDLLERALARANLSHQDRGLCQELAYGVVRQQRTLDWLISRRVPAPPKPGAPLCLLRLGLYQIFWLQRIPAHAAVHETVELARRLGCPGQAGFLNAVLRGCLREQEALAAQLATLKREDPALGYSHPAWLVERWQHLWGLDNTAQLLEWDNSPPPTYARLNLLKTDNATLTKLWQEAGVEFTPGQWDWIDPGQVFELRSYPSLAQWPLFQQGLFYIQDPSTLLAVRALNPQPGETILDFCAAPGGKTIFIAQLMGNRGRILAHDAQPTRLRRLAENCAASAPPALRPARCASTPPGRSTGFWWTRPVPTPASCGGGWSFAGACASKNWRACADTKACSSTKPLCSSSQAGSWSIAPAAWNRRKTKR